MKPIAGMTLVKDDRLVRVWRDVDGTLHAQGKRVAGGCGMTGPERRAYIDGKGDSIAAVKEIRAQRKCSLAEALDILTGARTPKKEIDHA